MDDVPLHLGRLTVALTLVVSAEACTAGSSGPAAVPSPPLGLPLLLPAPEYNRPTPARAGLGRRLFFDPVTSRDSTVSCATCHRPEHAFSDTTPVSRGVGGAPGNRNAPPLVNLAYASSLFRDGRAATLEEAVLRPVEDPTELDLPLEALVARLTADSGYRAAFDEAYGGVTEAAVAGALASFLRLVRSGDAPADRFEAGDREALSPAARRGRRLFLGKAGCAACHSGRLFTDGAFRATSTAAASGDPGRAAVTGRPEDRGKFRTPGLREVGRTAPYMHDGSLPTLEDVVRFYERGGEPIPNLDPEIRPFELTESERADLVAFLEALGGRVVAPAIDPP